jgi:RecB family exonuclease
LDLQLQKLHFYLKELFGEHKDDRNQELDDLAFGNLCHSVLDKFAKSEVKDSTDANEIASVSQTFKYILKFVG